MSASFFDKHLKWSFIFFDPTEITFQASPIFAGLGWQGTGDRTAPAKARAHGMRAGKCRAAKLSHK
ncbi:hypothetical protein [Novosphingobium sp.]|uniref:hypothetical protein n=1 Tax=Novosphingobium sp. TaxID=1874826 RepID=UPI0025D0F8E7|nr:hypothetical protein [Novosphingobium sp.]